MIAVKGWLSSCANPASHFTGQRNPRDVSQLCLVFAVASLRFPTEGDISHDDRVMSDAEQLETACAELDRECSSISPPRIQLPTTCCRRRMNGPLQSRQKIWRILDQFGKVVTDQSVSRTREQCFDRWVDRLDPTALIDRKDAVRHGVQNRRAQAFTVDKSKRETTALTDDCTEREAGCSQCEHKELKGPKSKLRMTLNFEPRDQAYLDR
jgi:hypothetical protein